MDDTARKRPSPDLDPGKTRLRTRNPQHRNHNTTETPQKHHRHNTETTNNWKRLEGGDRLGERRRGEERRLGEDGRLEEERRETGRGEERGWEATGEEKRGARRGEEMRGVHMIGEERRGRRLGGDGALPAQVAQRVVVDVGDQSKGQGLLRVVQVDRVLRSHRQHHAVR